VDLVPPSGGVVVGEQPVELLESLRKELLGPSLVRATADSEDAVASRVVTAPVPASAR
jgi:hypothetical protein